MTKIEILKAITEWQEHQKTLDSALDRLYDLMGTQGESPLLDAIYNIAGAHTDAVSALIGDESKFLYWWKHECKYGARPMAASKGDGKFRTVKTIKQLAGLIAE